MDASANDNNNASADTSTPGNSAPSSTPVTPSQPGVAAPALNGSQNSLEAIRELLKQMKVHCTEAEKSVNIPDYFKGSIALASSENIEISELVGKMKEKFETSLTRWKNKAFWFKVANFSIASFVILMQIAQVIISQTVDDDRFRDAIIIIFPAITGALIAIQLKFSWVAKAQKAKKYANLFHQLLQEVQYRDMMINSKGELDRTDFAKMWNASLHIEREIPATLFYC